MIFAKQNGRSQLLEQMRQLLPVAEGFSLAQAIDAFEISFANDRVEETSDGLMLVGWPIGRIGKRYFDIALCRPLGWEDEEWEEPPGQFIAQIKIPCGLPSLMLHQHCFQLEPSDRDKAGQFFRSIRATAMYRWYGVRKPMESKLVLWGGDEFFDMTAKLLPKLKEAGLLTCEDFCSIEPSTLGEPSDARETSTHSLLNSNFLPRSP